MVNAVVLNDVFLRSPWKSCSNFSRCQFLFSQTVQLRFALSIDSLSSQLIVSYGSLWDFNKKNQLQVEKKQSSMTNRNFETDNLLLYESKLFNSSLLYI